MASVISHASPHVHNEFSPCLRETFTFGPNHRYDSAGRALDRTRSVVMRRLLAASWRLRCWRRAVGRRTERLNGRRQARRADQRRCGRGLLQRVPEQARCRSERVAADGLGAVPQTVASNGGTRPGVSRGGTRPAGLGSLPAVPRCRGQPGTAGDARRGPTGRARRLPEPPTYEHRRRCGRVTTRTSRRFACINRASPTTACRS